MYKVTVGICVYKQSEWLFRCLRSLTAQNLPKNDFEVVVVNDEPGTDIEEICNNLRDVLNIRVINNEENIGLPESLNKILKTARGRYFVRIDSDDYVSAAYLYVLSLFLDLNRSYQAVSCDYTKVDRVGVVKSTHSFEKEPIACGVMFTYEALCEVGLYDKAFRMREGHDLMQRFMRKFSVLHLPVALYRYRIHDKNRSLQKKHVSKYDRLLKLKENGQIEDSHVIPPKVRKAVPMKLKKTAT
jgi:glycosyltransferase involved in cell wall biosynthesis